MKTELLMKAVNERCEALRQAGDTAAVEAEAAQARAALPALLSAEQSKTLEAMENLEKANQEYAALYGYRVGRYAGLQTELGWPDREADPLDTFVEKGLFTDPGMDRHPAFSARNNQVLELSAALEQELPQETFFHVDSILLSWEEKIHSAALIGYEMGLARSDSAESAVSACPA